MVDNFFQPITEIVFKIDPHGWLYNITNTQAFSSGCIINLPLEYCTPLVPRGVQYSSWKIYYTPLQMPVYLYNIPQLVFALLAQSGRRQS